MLATKQLTQLIYSITLLSPIISPVDFFIHNIADPGCEEGGHLLGDYCYTLHTEEKLSFQEAETTCRIFDAILSTQQDKFLINKLQQPFLNNYWANQNAKSPLETSDCTTINPSISDTKLLGNCSTELQYICQYTNNNSTSYNISSDVKTYMEAIIECTSFGASLAQTTKELEEFLQMELGYWIGTLLTTSSTLDIPKCLITTGFSEHITVDCSSKHHFVCKNFAISNTTHVTLPRERHHKDTNNNIYPLFLVGIVTTISVFLCFVTVVVFRQVQRRRNKGYHWVPTFESPREDQHSLINSAVDDDFSS